MNIRRSFTIYTRFESIKKFTQFVNRYNAFVPFVYIKRCESNQVFADLQDFFKQPKKNLKTSIKSLVGYFPITAKYVTKQ